MTDKVIIYQVFTRLFGNRNTTRKECGTIAENGSGKFNDFDSKTLNLAFRTSGTLASFVMLHKLTILNTVFLHSALL